MTVRLTFAAATAAACFCVISGGAFAADTLVTDAPKFEAGGFLPDQNVDQLTAMIAVPFSTDNPPVLQGELQKYNAIQTAADVERRAEAVQDAKNFEYEKLVATLKKSGMSPLKRHAITYELLRRVEIDTRNTFSAAKVKAQRNDATKFGHARPYAFTNEQVCFDEPKHPMAAAQSYPSGHAANMYVTSAILSEILPDGATKPSEERVQRYAENRVVCRAHWPSDVQAGLDLAKLELAALEKSPEFVQLRDCAKAELGGEKLSAECKALKPNLYTQVKSKVMVNPFAAKTDPFD